MGGVYYMVSLFLILSIVDRLYFLGVFKNKIKNEKVFCSADLNIIPIDHQFKLLFVNNNKKKFDIEPGDIFYISSTAYSSFSRPSIFFSKNNYNSIGCILRVHRNNTLSNNMERVKWNFNFLEQILDNEILPVFRGPYRNKSIYNRLVRDLQNMENNCCVSSRNPYHIQYLIAVDEGIAFQVEYLTYLQANDYTKMPYPTHIIFATSSKSLFNYICTNLQLLFIEIEDLTVECKLLPSNINLIPNIEEMVSYYKSEKIKELKKKAKELRESQDVFDDDKREEEEEEIIIDEELLSHITEKAIVEEMEYDILHYLSIPHILYHHNLKSYYQNHPKSKLSNRLNRKYDINHNENNNNTQSNSPSSPYPGYNFNEDIQIEMYYSGIPFVSNVLQNVCKICRIPYFTQNIY